MWILQISLKSLVSENQLPPRAWLPLKTQPHSTQSSCPCKTKCHCLIRQVLSNCRTRVKDTLVAGTVGWGRAYKTTKPVKSSGKLRNSNRCAVSPGLGGSKAYWNPLQLLLRKSLTENAMLVTRFRQVEGKLKSTRRRWRIELASEF